ncbi:hypothetical protein FOZ62_001519 [Perkinsus olseni]|uniref:Uncharacterized protein n=1 Tax=Perkinsus olseni TaxID=32597 RepID=A0A7J6TY52_PEROL|nr:hypothetical protein FOZ62_001519 [Perkinsus olseni]
MTPYVFLAIFFGATGPVLGQGSLFSKEQVEGMNLEKNTADLEEASIEDKLLEAIGTIPTEVPLGVLEGINDAEGATSDDSSDVQGLTSTPDYSGVLVGILVVTALIFVVLAAQLVLMGYMLSRRWPEGKRADGLQEPTEVADSV